MISAAAHGTINAQRTRRRPGNAAFSSWARPSEITMVTPTTSATHVTVLATTVGSASWSRRRA